MHVSDYQLNRLNLLKAIRRHGPISRSELTAMSGLASGTITQLTAELVRREMIFEVRERPVGRGRPQQKLQINADGAIVLGAAMVAHLGLELAFVDLSGRRIHEVSISMPGPASLEEFARNTTNALRSAVLNSPFDRSKIKRIGLSLPGVIDTTRGNLHLLGPLPPGDVPLARMIADEVGLPVTLENDILCMARAQHWFGSLQDQDDFTLIYVGHTIGNAEYYGGLPRYRQNGILSEFAHIKTGMTPDNRPCWCGSRGCLQAYSSMYGILHHLDPSIPFLALPMAKLDEAFNYFLDNAEHAEHARQLQIAGAHLGLATANYLNATGPANLLFLSHDARFAAGIEESFGSALLACTHPEILARSKTRFANADPNWRWQGTAALALERAYLDLT
jgi:predicted NBD/HSP70 family sugar kinase